MNNHGEIEIGLIVGSIVSRMEETDALTFTNDMSYDDEFLKLALRLFEEFNSDKYSEYHYFSEFVQDRLLELENENFDKKISTDKKQMWSIGTK